MWPQKMSTLRRDEWHFCWGHYETDEYMCVMIDEVENNFYFKMKQTKVCFSTMLT